MTILRFPRPLRLSGELFRLTALRRCALEECHAACCLHGVWVDPLEKADILRHADRIIPHMPADRRDPAKWFGPDGEQDPFYPSGCVVPSAVAPNPAHYGGTECVFLRADSLCSLQVASGAAGMHPWRWKPFHCIIHPVTIEDGVLTVAPDGDLLAEPGSCFRAGAPGGRMSDFLSAEIGFLQSVGQGA